MSYRPITDQWFLARAKLKGGVKRYGAYLGGFPERARVLIGCPLDQPLFHVCGGHAKLYPYNRGLGEKDVTMDLDPAVNPDILMDCRNPEWPTCPFDERFKWQAESEKGSPWGGILIDPPYSEKDAEEYAPGADKYPKPNQLIKSAIDSLRVGYKVGLIHYIVPMCPKNAKFIADVGITCGFNNRKRVFTVFERIS